MPYSIDWYIENEVVYIHYSGETAPDELRDSLLTIIKMIDGSSHTLVHVIADVGDVTKPISPKEALDVVREVGSHPRTGWNIILRERSLLVKIGVAFGTSIFKSRNRTFDTIEEVNAFLAEKDTKLNWDNVNKSLILLS